MKNHHRTIFASFTVLALVGAASLITHKTLKADEHEDSEGAITIASLAGPWQMTLTGFTGCGMSTSVVTFTLDTNGTGSATNRSHTSGCGDPVSTGTPFTIQSLNPNGSGKAGLSCGTGCGWGLEIQVAKNRQIFNVVDIDPLNPGNYLEGTAIHQ
jgi:hypothetical protein